MKFNLWKDIKLKQNVLVQARLVISIICLAIEITKIFYQIIKINKTQILLKKYFLVHEVLNFLKNDGNMFKYYKRLDDVLMFEKQSLP